MPAGATIRFLVSVATAVTMMGGAASCGRDSENDDLPPPASPPRTADLSPGLDLSPAEQEAVDEAQARFDEFMSAYIRVSTADLPDAAGGEDLILQLEEQADGELPGQLRREIVGRWGDGQITEGTLRWTLVDVVEVDLELEINGRTFPTVLLRYCVDSTSWRSIDAESGDVAGSSGERHHWLYTMSWSDDWGGFGTEGWRAVEREAQAEQAC